MTSRSGVFGEGLAPAPLSTDHNFL